MALTRPQPSALPVAEALEDAELVARVLGGDGWSRDVLYRRHARRLLSMATRLMASRTEGEEVVQDAFLKAFSHLRKLREPPALHAWLTTITINLVRRRLRRARLLRLLGLDRGADDATLAALASPTLGPDQRAELALIDRVLRAIPEDQCIAWKLRRVEGLPLAEVAAACECSLATAKRRVAAVDAQVSNYVSIRDEDT